MNTTSTTRERRAGGRPLDKNLLQRLARRHGTPLLVIDHEVIRRNYASFRRHLPRVQAYYAVKANSEAAIVRTLYRAGASFDVASWPEFLLVHEHIRKLPPRKQQDYIWDKVVYSHPIKDEATLKRLDPYRPLVAYDNLEEIGKIRRHAPHAGLLLRVSVPNTGSMVELASKFGCPPADAVDLIAAAHFAGLTVEGLAFHVGSQCRNPENYVQALGIASQLFREAKARGYELKVLDIGGGFPVPYDRTVQPLARLARTINAELRRLFPPGVEVIAEPGRFLVATAATLVVSIVGKARREGKLCYYVDDGIYHTFSGILFDHCQYHLEAFRAGPTELCSVFGPTCDALDTISQAELLPSDL
ncbi:MAG: type III PLP-dependent enzyme, partial [Planctomycetes bacterium]|nr:type III PLP-dependent enzyme [Planctomycetota bacterium]